MQISDMHGAGRVKIFYEYIALKVLLNHFFYPIYFVTSSTSTISKPYNDS